MVKIFMRNALVTSNFLFQHLNFGTRKRNVTVIDHHTEICSKKKEKNWSNLESKSIHFTLRFVIIIVNDGWTINGVWHNLSYRPSRTLLTNSTHERDKMFIPFSPCRVTLYKVLYLISRLSSRLGFVRVKCLPTRKLRMSVPEE